MDLLPDGACISALRSARDPNDLIDVAERAHVGKPALIEIMSRITERLHYSHVVNAPSSYHVASSIAAPPSVTPIGRLIEILKGN